MTPPPLPNSRLTVRTRTAIPLLWRKRAGTSVDAASRSALRHVLFRAEGANHIEPEGAERGQGQGKRTGGNEHSG